MTFREATGRLMELGIGAPEIGEALGLAAQTIRTMRMDPDSPHARTPPAGWERPLAGLARSRSAALEALARELEGA